MAVGIGKFDEEKERERLRKLSDRELIREARDICVHLLISGSRHGMNS